MPGFWQLAMRFKLIFPGYLNSESGMKISTVALLWQEFWFGSLKNSRTKSWL
jgi:hypothetical protein